MGLCISRNTSPLRSFEKGTFRPSCLRGFIFINIIVRDRNDISSHHRLQSYYGYAFESWCTSSALPSHVLPSTATQTQPATETQAPNGWGGDVDTNVEWCCVVKTKLGSTRMVLGGEVDCVRGSFLLMWFVNFSFCLPFVCFFGDFVR